MLNQTMLHELAIVGGEQKRQCRIQRNSQNIDVFRRF
jgi:hypothetical protein